MSRAQECGEFRRELGVYVVGAIGGADRRTVDDHLASCPDCREELAGLAGLPGLLARVPVSEMESLVGQDGSGADELLLPDASLGSLLRRASHYRRHHMWPQLAAAASVGLILGGGAAVAASQAMMASPGQRASTALQAGSTVRGSNPQTKASAIVRYVAEPWGIELYIHVSGVPAGTNCAFEVVDADGHASVAGSWIVTVGNQDAWYSGSSSEPASGVRSFAVTTGATTLVRVSVPESPTLTGGLR